MLLFRCSLVSLSLSSFGLGDSFPSLLDDEKPDLTLRNANGSKYAARGARLLLEEDSAPVVVLFELLSVMNDAGVGKRLCLLGAVVKSSHSDCGSAPAASVMVEHCEVTNGSTMMVV